MPNAFLFKVTVFSNPIVPLDLHLPPFPYSNVCVKILLSLMYFMLKTKTKIKQKYGWNSQFYNWILNSIKYRVKYMINIRKPNNIPSSIKFIIVLILAHCIMGKFYLGTIHECIILIYQFCYFKIMRYEISEPTMQPWEINKQNISLLSGLKMIASFLFPWNSNE